MKILDRVLHDYAEKHGYRKVKTIASVKHEITVAELRKYLEAADQDSSVLLEAGGYWVPIDRIEVDEEKYVYIS